MDPNPEMGRKERSTRYAPLGQKWLRLRLRSFGFALLHLPQTGKRYQLCRDPWLRHHVRWRKQLIKAVDLVGCVKGVFHSNADTVVSFPTYFSFSGGHPRHTSRGDSEVRRREPATCSQHVLKTENLG